MSAPARRAFAPRRVERLRIQAEHGRRWRAALHQERERGGAATDIEDAVTRAGMNLLDQAAAPFSFAGRKADGCIVEWRQGARAQERREASGPCHVALKSLAHVKDAQVRWQSLSRCDLRLVTERFTQSLLSSPVPGTQNGAPGAFASDSHSSRICLRGGENS